VLRTAGAALEMFIDVFDERIASLLEVSELIPARAAGAEQEDVAGFHARDGGGDGAVERLACEDTCLVRSIFDQRRRRRANGVQTGERRGAFSD